MTKKELVKKLVQNEIINYKNSSTKTKENIIHFLLTSYYNDLSPIQLQKLVQNLYYK